MASVPSVVGRWRNSLTGRVLIAAVACVAVFAGQARAQNMGAQFDIGSTPVSKRSLEEYAKLLGMDEAQKEAAADLLTGYREQLRVVREDRNAKLESLTEDMMESKDWMGAQKKMAEEGLKFRDEFKKLEESFATDVKTLLTEKQLEKWELVERHRRRDLHLRFQLYTGGAVDVVNIVNRTGTAPDTAEFRDLLTQYEVAVDNHLKAWEQKGKEVEEDMKKDDANVMGAQMKAMEDLGPVSKQIRDVNRDYANRVMGLMNEEQKSKFEAAFNERAYPRVYKKVHVVDRLEAASKLEDLDTTQKEVVASLKGQWAKESRPLNAAWAQALVAEEDESGGLLMSMMKGWQGEGTGEGKAADVKAAREARKELETRITKRLDEVLTPAQREKLPRKKMGDNNPWEEMMGMGQVIDEDE